MDKRESATEEKNGRWNETSNVVNKSRKESKIRNSKPPNCNASNETLITQEKSKNEKKSSGLTAAPSGSNTTHGAAL
jgi:hypothetical protein